MWTFSVLLLSPFLLGWVQANPVLVWDCSPTTGIPNICENMCWGTFCSANPGDLLTLVYDTPSETTEDSRRSTAGCKPNPNRCSAKWKPAVFPDGEYSCDEFPFASTKQAVATNQVNRCVPAVENNSQGGILKSFYAAAFKNNGIDCTKTSCAFDMVFLNAPASSYCTKGNTCLNSATFFQSTKATVKKVQSTPDAQNTKGGEVPGKKQAHSLAAHSYKVNIAKTAKKAAQTVPITSYKQLTVGAKAYMFGQKKTSTSGTISRRMQGNRPVLDTRDKDEDEDTGLEASASFWEAQEGVITA